MSIPRKAGRFFLPSDRPDSPKVIVISEPMAQQYFAGRDPLGKRLRINTGTKEPFEGEIVGVAGGVRHENLTQQPRVEIYLPFAQRPYPVANIVVRSTNSRETLAAAMKQTLHNQDRELPIYRIRGMEDVVLDSAAAPRARGFLTAVFAIAALLLASIGIYGVMSFAVSRRTQEIGIRMAVGASPFSVLRLILRESGTLVLLGVGAGLMAALVLGRLLSTFLFRVSAFNPVVLALVCLLLVLVAIAATSVPAWRAARVDPLDALRQE